MSKKVFSGVGHGGNDGGAYANGLKESDVNLVMATACNGVLIAHGVQNPMSRYKDENDPLQEEIREANASGATIAIDFHNNAGGGDGFEAYHSKNDTAGKRLCECIEKRIVDLGQNSRGVKTKVGAGGKDYFGFIRETTMTAIIIESFFLDSADHEIADTIEEQKSFGVAIAKGILDYLGIKYIGEATQPTPEPPKPIPPTNSIDREIKRYHEKGKCTIVAKDGIIFRDAPSTDSGKRQGVYEYGESVYYDLVVLTDHYVWISWIGASTGTRRYMPVLDKRNNKRWGNCV